VRVAGRALRRRSGRVPGWAYDASTRTLSVRTGQVRTARPLAVAYANRKLK
jgi:hypothetical protein